jgi:trimeric autotransporter adhesin
MFSDGTGDSHLRSAGTFVTLNYGQAAFTPFTDQGAYLGLAGRRWAVVYTAGLVVYAGAVFAGALSGITNIAMSGGISGMTTLSMSGGISGATTGTFSATVSAANFSTSGAVSAGSVTAAFHYASLRVLPTSDNVAAVGQSGTMFSEMWTYNGYKPGGGSWTATSDDRAKMDTFKPFDDGLDTILRLDPVLYTYNGLYGMPKGSEHVGFRAQELQEIVPEMVGMVRAKRTGADDEPYEDVLTVDTTRLEYMLVNAVKELHAEIERLKSQLAERTN